MTRCSLTPRVWVVAGFLATVPAWSATPTFTETVAPILYKNCTTCHRPGEAAPFALLTYDDARKHGATVAAATRSRYMPPWHAEHGFGEFRDERRLTDDEIASIDAWVKGGMPEGDRSKLPSVPQFADGWHLGKPDLILEMPTAFEVPASGPDVYRNFAIPTGLTEDKWVRAIEFRPSARKAVHHALFSYRTGGGLGGILGGRGGRFGGGQNGAGGGRGGRLGGRGGANPDPGAAVGARGAGLANGGALGNAAGLGAGAVGNSLGGWAVGATPTFLPEGLAFQLPQGSDFILQTHFHPTGKVESEKSLVGIYFADKAPERVLQVLQVPALFGIGAGIDIAPGQKAFTIRDSMTLPVDVRAFAVSAHAHYIAKEMEATATLPDGSTQPLLWIKNWDFNWQDRYDYRSSMVLPKGTRIDGRLVYDNSADNPRNPSSPPKEVYWGEQSFDEMGSVSLLVTAVNKEDEAALRQIIQSRSAGAVVQAALSGGLTRLLEFRLGQGQGRGAR